MTKSCVEIFILINLNRNLEACVLQIERMMKRYLEIGKIAGNRILSMCVESNIFFKNYANNIFTILVISDNYKKEYMIVSNGSDSEEKVLSL